MKFINIYSKGLHKYSLIQLLDKFNSVLRIDELTTPNDYIVIKKLVDKIYKVVMQDYEYDYLINLEYPLSYDKFIYKIDTIINTNLVDYLLTYLPEKQVITKDQIDNILTDINVNKDYIIKSLLALKGTKDIVDYINTNDKTNNLVLKWNPGYELECSIDELVSDHTKIINELEQAFNFLLYFRNRDDFEIKVMKFMQDIVLIKYTEINTIYQGLNYIIASETDR